MTLLSVIKNIVEATPLEGLARDVFTRLSPSKGGRYDRQAIQVMRRVLKPDSNCIDVGAYRGGMLREMVRLAPFGKHVAFEPVPAQYQYLCKSFPEVKVYPLALSDTAQETSFQHVASRPTYSGLARTIYPRADERVEAITVQTELLDHVIPAGSPVHLIKVDVEGAEQLVFRGGVRTIRENRPVIVFEHGLLSEYCFGIGSAEVFDLLTGACGLHISLMSEWLEGRASLARQEFIDEVAQARNYYFMAHP